MLDDKSTIKDTLHYLLVAIYLFPKFHECLTHTFMFIEGFSFIAQLKMAAKFEDKAETKNIVHNLLVALYLFPKFYECLTSTF